jgi:hypothetical protein
MNIKWLGLLGVVSVGAMMGSTACIIVDGTSGSGGSGGSGGDASTSDTSTSANVATSSTGSGACVSCAEFYSNGGMGDLCPASLTLATALNDCACNACTTECGQACDSTDAACDTCLQNAALDQCKAESTACSNDT